MSCYWKIIGLGCVTYFEQSLGTPIVNVFGIGRAVYVDASMLTLINCARTPCISCLFTRLVLMYGRLIVLLKTGSCLPDLYHLLIMSKGFGRFLTAEYV